MTDADLDFDKWVKLVPLVSLIITVIGWNISSYLSSKNTSRHSKNAEINRLIESLYKNLDEIYNEMISLLLIDVDEKKKTSCYHKFIGYVKNIKFTCEAINQLDNKQIIPTDLIAELRMACTDDRKYESNKIHTTLPELQSIHERIKKSYLKKFN